MTDRRMVRIDHFISGSGKIKAETGEASAFLVCEDSDPPRDRSFTFDGIT